MNNKKHFIVAILLTMATFGQVAAQTTNVSFDNEGERWFALSGKATVVDQGHKGKGLLLQPGTTLNIPVRLQPNMRYRVSAWLRTASGETTVTLKSIDFGRDFAVASAKPDWTLVSNETYMGEKPAGKHKPYIEVAFNGNSEAWVDEIKVEPLGKYVAKAERGIPKKEPRQLVTDFGITQQGDSAMRWMHDAKIGMFIHWGLYSGIAKGEWYQQNVGMLPDDYRKTAYPESGNIYFDARDYDADRWMQTAKAMGARYTVLTTMHHDGFALFDSHYMNAFTSKQTLNRDLVAEYVAAARRAGMRVGFYKTLINWRFPGYYDITGTDCKKNSFGYSTAVWHKENARLMKEELYCQTRELMKNYGKVDMLFWDGGWISQKNSDRQASFFWEPYRYLDPTNEWQVNPYFQEKDEKTGMSLGLVGMVRKLQPDIVMNPRCGWIGDYTCDEGDADIMGEIRKVPQEKNITLGKTWGYTSDMERRELLTPLTRLQRYLADCMVRDINLLINVSPDCHGNIPMAQHELLVDFGRWVESISDAVYETTGGPWQPKDNQYGFCYKGNKIFVYVLDGHHMASLRIPDVDKGMRLLKAYDVATGIVVPFRQKGNSITLEFSPVKKDQIKVVCMEFNRNIY